MRRARLILSPSGKWIKSPHPNPYNLSSPRDASTANPPPPPSSTRYSFDTLATIPKSASLQAPQYNEGPREAVPSASVVPIPAPKRNPAKVYRGIEIPEKPPPPAPDECCQSGCAHCTYDIYQEDLELYHDQLAEARKAIVVKTKGLKLAPGEWPEELGEREMPEGGEGPKEQAERSLKSSLARLDPVMRAFLEMEARLKKKPKAKPP